MAFRKPYYVQNILAEPTTARCIEMVIDDGCRKLSDSALEVLSSMCTFVDMGATEMSFDKSPLALATLSRWHDEGQLVHDSIDLRPGGIVYYLCEQGSEHGMRSFLINLYTTHEDYSSPPKSRQESTGLKREVYFRPSLHFDDKEHAQAFLKAHDGLTRGRADLQDKLRDAEGAMHARALPDAWLDTDNPALFCKDTAFFMQLYGFIAVSSPDYFLLE